MATPLAWKNMLDGIDASLAQVEAAAAVRERDMERPAPAPLGPDSNWQAGLFSWDGLVAKLPAAAAEAEGECQATDAMLAGQESELQTWLRALQATWGELAAWDQRHGSAAAHTIKAR